MKVYAVYYTEDFSYKRVPDFVCGEEKHYLQSITEAFNFMDSFLLQERPINQKAMLIETEIEDKTHRHISDFPVFLCYVGNDEKYLAFKKRIKEERGKQIALYGGKHEK